jgi:hypothetical protein
MQNAGAVELQERIGALAARIHAATAELVQLSAELDADGSWSEIGVRSCAHWLSINVGVDIWTGALTWTTSCRSVAFIAAVITRAGSTSGAKRPATSHSRLQMGNHWYHWPRSRRLVVSTCPDGRTAKRRALVTVVRP